MTNDQIIGAILGREGFDKFTDRASDRGGPTKWGITLTSWRAWTKNPAATVEDLKAVTADQAHAFYLHEHITGPAFDKIETPLLRELVIDAGVHHGPAVATEWLQAAAGVESDGKFGPKSIAAVNEAGAIAGIFLRFIALRFRKFGNIVTRDPQAKAAKAAGFDLQAENAAGWNNRAAEFLDRAAVECTPRAY